MPARTVALLIALSGLGVSSAPAAPLRIAAAANLRGTLDRIAEQFEVEERPAGGISITYGSTGKLYAQIVHGAPFDLFFAADVEHARRLDEAGLAVPGSRTTYALGRLAAWGLDGAAPEERLASGELDHLALASPRVAPYGRAARQVLEARGFWPTVESRVVWGEDVGKVFHFVRSGAADLGFVPLSLVTGSELGGVTWIVPLELHDPIEQQAVQLGESDAARAFLDFVHRDAARETLAARGYALP